MQLIFENMDELRELIAAMGYVKAPLATLHRQIGDVSVTLTGQPADIAYLDRAADDCLAAERGDITPATIASELGSDAPGPITAGEHLDAGTPVHVEEGVATKRKRRTKAEIEADKAAQTVAAVEALPNVDAPIATVNPLDNLKSDPAPAPVYNGDAHQAITETAGLFDGNDKLAHLNEGREFISKHGFALYNESQRLADVPPNIAAHTPEQVSRHRAAMAWLNEQQAKP